MVLPEDSASSLIAQAAGLLRPNLGTCLTQGKSGDIRYSRTLSNSFVIGIYSRFRIGIELALSLLSEAAAT